MSKNLAQLLKNARQEGIAQGFAAWEAASLLAMYNVNARGERRIMSDKRLGQFCRDVEKELSRLYHEEYANYHDNFADVIIGHVESLRERLEMDCP